MKWTKSNRIRCYRRRGETRGGSRFTITLLYSDNYSNWDTRIPKKVVFIFLEPDGLQRIKTGRTWVNVNHGCEMWGWCPEWVVYSFYTTFHSDENEFSPVWHNLIQIGPSSLSYLRHDALLFVFVVSFCAGGSKYLWWASSISKSILQFQTRHAMHQVNRWHAKILIHK